jgi:hypothetical protein
LALKSTFFHYCQASSCRNIHLLGTLGLGVNGIFECYCAGNLDYLVHFSLGVGDSNTVLGCKDDGKVTYVL